MPSNSSSASPVDSLESRRSISSSSWPSLTPGPQHMDAGQSSKSVMDSDVEWTDSPGGPIDEDKENEAASSDSAKSTVPEDNAIAAEPIDSLGNDYRSNITETHIKLIRFKYNIPSIYGHRIPKSYENSLSAGPREFAVCEEAFRCGFRLPLTDFQSDILNEFDIAPIQLLPNSWLFMTDFEEVCKKIKVPMSVRLFCHLTLARFNPGYSGLGYCYLSYRSGGKPPKYESNHKNGKRSGSSYLSRKGR